MEFSVERLARVVGGKVVGGKVVRDIPHTAQNSHTAQNVSIDSRKILGGEVFIPIVGERDGHDFIEDAIQKGASIYLTSQEDRSAGAACILVKDTLKALQDLAIHTRQERLEAQVVAITGTVGKTSTKDLALAAVSSSLRVHANEKSENNYLGVPLTLCNAPKGVEVVLAEVGASAVGEIKSLANILKPDIGLVTTIGAAHIEGFGSLQAVKQAKAELVEALLPTGTAVLNADPGGSGDLAGLTKAEVLTYGVVSEADVRASEIRRDENLRTIFLASTPWGEAEVRLGVIGNLNVGNALAALCIAGILGVDLGAAAKGLETAELSPLRMELKHRDDGLLVINDTYNANPTSMKAALEELQSLPAKNHIAVLGTMAELGDIHETAHKEVAEFASQLGVEIIAFQEPAYGVETADDIGSALKLLEARSYTAKGLGQGDAVLLKASRVAHLEDLATALLVK